MSAEDFIISKKRKKYKFARFAEYENCYELEAWVAAAKKNTSKKTVVELGAGTGLFLVEYARLHPSSDCVAVDVKADRLQAGAKLALEQKLNNITFLRVHASQLDEAFTANSIGELWLTFPDPFPKKRSAKHRLTHPNFLAMYKKLLSPAGSLHVKTDDRTLFEYTQEQLGAAGWHIRKFSYDLHASELPPDYKVMTRYETRFVAQDLPIHFLSAHKPISPK